MYESKVCLLVATTGANASGDVNMSSSSPEGEPAAAVAPMDTSTNEALADSSNSDLVGREIVKNGADKKAPTPTKAAKAKAPRTSVGGEAKVKASSKPSKRRRVDPDREIGDNEKVFVVRSTGEFFRSYEKYFKRVCELMERKFECPVTGKSSLSYEESLASAKLANRRLKRFPEEHLGAVLKIVQHSTSPLSELISKTYAGVDSKVPKALLRLKIKVSIPLLCILHLLTFSPNSGVCDENVIRWWALGGRAITCQEVSD